MKLTFAASVVASLSGLGGRFAHGIERDGANVSRLLNPVCIGSSPVLESTKKLYSNQYICTTDEKGKEYRFGLSSDGTLQEVHVDADGTESVYWSPQKKGSYLRMQGDGNIVLRDEDGNAVWSSGCFGEGGFLTFHPMYPSIGARTYPPDGGPHDSYWSVRSWEENGSCHPPIKCRGHVLEPGQSLERDEYLCAVDEGWNHSYRFGVGNNGLLALFWQNQPIWTPEEQTAGSHVLRMQLGGKLILRNDDNDIIWENNCKSDGNKVQLTSHGVLMTDNNDDTSWYVSYDGEESDCFPNTIPPDLCTQISRMGNKCRMRMIDHLNIWYTTLEVEEVGPNKYVVTDNIESACDREPWPVKVEKLESGALIFGAGVPEVTCKEMIDGWPMVDDRQLTFLPDTFGDDPEEYPCTDFGRNVIYFLIEEWFYFG